LIQLLAIVVALSSGAIAAWYAYYYKGSTVNGLLALLRVLWFGMLVYAILAPELIQEESIVLPKNLHVYEDTSASVVGSLREAKDVLVGLEKEKNVRIHHHYFQPHERPLSPWVYLGDGHVNSKQGLQLSEVRPVAVHLVDGVQNLPSRIISGISVPQRIAKGSTFKLIGRSLEPGVKWTFGVNGSRFVNETGILELVAPQKAGPLKISVRAEMQNRTDSISIDLEVVESLRIIDLYYEYPAPEVGLFVRESTKLNTSINQQKGLPNIPNGKNARIYIGSASWVEKAIESYTGSASLFYIIDEEKSTTENQNLKQLGTDIDRSIKTLGPIDFQPFEKGLKLQGIELYKSAIRFGDQGIEKALLEKLLVLVIPMTLEMDLPQRGYKGQSVEGLLYLMGPDGRPEDFTGTVEVFESGELVDRPALRQLEDQTKVFVLDFPVPGNYEIKFNGTSKFGDIRAEKKLTVEDTDVEMVTPFNLRLLNDWNFKVEDARDIEAFEQDITSWLRAENRVLIQKKNPQHNHWWYWGLVLFAASTEWLLRRRKGMI
jgi:hypothetical protein